MVCKFCGKEVLSGDKFCNNCGAEIEEGKNEQKVEEVNFNSSPIEMKNENNNSNVNEGTKKESGKGFKIASLVLGIISLVFFLLSILMLPLEIIGLVLGIIYTAKNKKFCAGIVLNIIAMILSFVLFFGGIALITSVGEDLIEENTDRLEQISKDLENELEQESNKINNTLNSNKYNVGYKYVGSDEYGYMKVPNNWAKFIDVDGNNTIQYSYANVWISTIYSPDVEGLTTYKYAQNIFDIVKQEGAKNVKLTMETVADKYFAYKVSCYYEKENIYLNCWVFEDDDDKIHYISIEGPDKISDYYDLVNTFNTEKE